MEEAGQGECGIRREIAPSHEALASPAGEPNHPRHPLDESPLCRHGEVNCQVGPSLVNEQHEQFHFRVPKTDPAYWDDSANSLVEVAVEQGGVVSASVVTCSDSKFVVYLGIFLVVRHTTAQYYARI